MVPPSPASMFSMLEPQATSAGRAFSWLACSALPDIECHWKMKSSRRTGLPSDHWAPSLRVTWTCIGSSLMSSGAPSKIASS